MVLYSFQFKFIFLKAYAEEQVQALQAYAAVTCDCCMQVSGTDHTCIAMVKDPSKYWNEVTYLFSLNSFMQRLEQLRVEHGLQEISTEQFRILLIRVNLEYIDELKSMVKILL